MASLPISRDHDLVAGCGREMQLIGCFVISHAPPRDAVRVLMSWGRQQSRIGQILAPPDIEREVAARNLPGIAEPLPLESAFSYAVNLAMLSGLSLYLTGDATVWNEVWGKLVPYEEGAAKAAQVLGQFLT